MPLQRMQQRRDTAANWASTDPILAAGEIGVDTTTSRIRLGDGTTVWSGLEEWNLTQADIDPAIAAILADEGSGSRAVLEAAIEAAVASEPGSEMGYAARTSNFTTTNTSTASLAAGSKVTGLSVVVEGTGRPVDVWFEALARHSVPDKAVLCYLIVNNIAESEDGQVRGVSSPDTTNGRNLEMKRRLVLTDGVVYTFDVGIAGESAGTSTVMGGEAFPIELSVVPR